MSVSIGDDSSDDEEEGKEGEEKGEKREERERSEGVEEGVVSIIQSLNSMNLRPPLCHPDRPSRVSMHFLQCYQQIHHSLDLDHVYI